MIDGVKIKKTRKDHECWLCGKRIPKGSNARGTVQSTPEHGIYRLWEHPECTKLATSLDYDYEMHSIEGFGEYLEEERRKEAERWQGKLLA